MQIARDARLDDGQGRAALSPGRRPGEPPFLSWLCLDGEPQRARGGGRGDAGDRNGRARGGGGFQPALAQMRNPRRRQGLLKARGIEPHVAINGTVSKLGKTRKTAVPSEVAASVPPGL